MTESHPLTTEALLVAAAASLAGDTPRLDAELLLEAVTGWSRTRFRAWPERVPEPTCQRAFQALLARRQQGEPIAHILGSQDFWSLTLKVNTHTLIPRADTECLVEAALELPLPQTCRALDLGTGTGAIALALAKERPGWVVMATDRVPEAVALATANALQLGLGRVSVIQSRWFDQLPATRFDLIVSNPPYIPADDVHLTQGDVRYEPASALVAGADGLDDLREIIAAAPQWLNTGGWLVVEHGYDQQEAVQALFQAAGFQALETRRDYGGNPRLTLGTHHAE
ncbi:MAG: peptide chain release factor N(5)-glutamine methyltransferase [Marinobacter sp.]|nr:peptide chain release factor N(5)-glutamine methyltransferase [Marinobacter sp.]